MILFLTFIFFKLIFNFQFSQFLFNNFYLLDKKKDNSRIEY